MELLLADQISLEPAERCFRPGRSGPLILLGVLLVPLGAAVALRAGIAEVAGVLPWPVWLLAAPPALLGCGLYALCLAAATQVARRAWLPSSWSARLAPGRLLLNVRSFQNAHFPHDGPTVVRLALDEIASMREVRDVTRREPREAAAARRRWLQLELTGVDTTVLERIVRAERERPGPTTRSLGVARRTRFLHVPLQVTAPGVLRLEWPGRALPRALVAAGVTLAERLDLDLARSPGLDARLAELVRRGDRLGAITLARTELGLTLRETKALVERLGREAA